MPKNGKANSQQLVSRGQAEDKQGLSKGTIDKPIKQYKQYKPIEDYFIDLENGNHIIELARINNIDVNILKKQIPNFKKYAELEYESYSKFVSHFKNWYNKTKGITLDSDCPYTDAEMTYFRKLYQSDLGLPTAFDKRFTHLLKNY